MREVRAGCMKNGMETKAVQEMYLPCSNTTSQGKCILVVNILGSISRFGGNSFITTSTPCNQKGVLSL